MKSEAWNRISKFQVFFRFWVKIPCFYHSLSKLQAFSRPGKENDKIPVFQGFPGKMGTLYMYLAWISTILWHYAIQGSHFFSNTTFKIFSRFLVLNSRFFQVFLCQIPGTFIQILVIKILKCVKTDGGFPLLLWHKIPCIFQVISS